MKFINMLSSSTSVGSYDKTKTSLFGNAYSKTINTKTCFGPSLTKFIDVQTDFTGYAPAITQSGVTFASSNNRLFVLGTFTAGVAPIALYSIDYTTGAKTALGRITITLPNTAATTHTPRFMRVIDTGTTGWKIFIGTIGSVAVNGGVFLVNKVDIADFSFNPTANQFYMGLSSDIKATYLLEDPTLVGVNHAMTTIMGGGYSSADNQILTTKGTAASLSIDGFSTTTAPTITSYTATAPTVPASPTFTLTAHGFNANDMLVFTANTPGGFTVSTQVAAQTVYFVRNPTANTFELSATSGGASINATTATTPSFVRAFGTTTALYVAARKSGTIATAFAGTALLVDNQQIVTPADGPNAGSLCYFLSTTTTFYCWKLSDMTSGVTSLPSAAGINNTGTGIDYVAPTNVLATYSEVLGKVVYTSAAFSIFMKSWINSNISHSFGSQINTWLENTGRTQDYFRGFVTSSLDVRNGWIFLGITTTGQRGILMMDARSDQSFNYTYMTSPVQYVGSSVMKFVSTIEQLFNVTDTIEIYYRTAATSSDAIFNTDSGSWTQISVAQDLTSIALNNYVQVKVTWDITTTLSGIPTQVQDIVIGYQSINELSDNWVGSVDNTSRNGESPAYSAFRLIKAYSTSVPTLYFRAYDDNGNLVISADTVTNPTLFQYSTNNGTSWNALGTIPNTIGTTEVRYAWATPPGVKVTVSLRES